MIDQPILLTGCARSGTSLTAGLVQLSGAFGGQTVPGNINNAKGFFENMEIREKLVKPYLRSIGCDPLAQKDLPTSDQVTIPNKWRGRFVDVMVRHGYTGGHVYYKGAKMCLMWQVWADAFPDAQWIIVRRKDEEIIRSCMQTGFMTAYRDALGWQGWIDIHKDRFAEMKEAGLNVIEYWPEDLFKADDFDSIKQLILNLGLDWNESLVREFVEPKLWKGKGRS
jgi:hypothetical protein